MQLASKVVDDLMANRLADDGQTSNSQAMAVCGTTCGESVGTYIHA
jgi:hypothetical protein